jgi:acyl-coenzyme A synthetase/AMP-(fatty) acid ligase
VLSYEELLAEVSRGEGVLADRRIAPRELVGISADYGPASVALLLATMQRGAVALLSPNSEGRAAERAGALGARGVFEEVSRGEILWRDGAERSASQHPLLAELAPGRGGFAILTSGTEGDPKLALHASWRWLAKFERPGKAHRTLAFLLFDHIAGLDTLFSTLAAGGTLITVDDRSPDGVCRAIERHRVEVLPTSPTFCRLLCLGDAPERFDLSSLQTVAYGSEPMSEANLEMLTTRLPGVRLLQRYGTSEFGSPASRSRSDGSTWLQIRSGELELDVRDGVLWVRSERSMLGYLNAPQPFADEGWYCTGDVVEQDGDWLRILGRASDRINVGGEKVSPDEVSAVLLELDWVRAARVDGLPHAILGQVVRASLDLAPEAPRGAALRRAVRAHCRIRLAAHKVPVKVVETTAREAGGAKARRLGAPEASGG